jgi:hypothetical protein
MRMCCAACMRWVDAPVDALGSVPPVQSVAEVEAEGAEERQSIDSDELETDDSEEEGGEQAGGLAAGSSGKVGCSEQPRSPAGLAPGCWVRVDGLRMHGIAREGCFC